MLGIMGKLFLKHAKISDQMKKRNAIGGGDLLISGTADFIGFSAKMNEEFDVKVLEGWSRTDLFIYVWKLLMLLKKLLSIEIFATAQIRVRV